MKTKKSLAIFGIIMIVIALFTACGGGGPKLVPVTAITVTGEGNEETVLTGETLQMESQILPLNASNKGVTWTVENAANDSARDCHAEITQEGVLTGLSEGTVIVKATAKDGSEVEGNKEITIFDELKKWEFSTEGRIWASNPAIGNDGTIYVGSDDGKLYAINNDGTKKWEFNTGDWIRSSPTIGSDGTIYLGSHFHHVSIDSDDGKLYAINNDGTKKWEFNTGAGDAVSSPAIGSDGTIFVSSGGELYAINADGTKKWQIDPLQGLITNDAASPSIGSDGTIYVTIYETLYAINSNGSKKWEFTTEGEWIWFHPAIGSDGTIYVGSGSKLYAINADGTKKWEFTTENSVNHSSCIGSDGTIYVGSGSKLYAINADGTKKWEFTTEHYNTNNPAIGSDGTIFVSSGSKLYIINTDGTKKWEFTAGDDIFCSPAIGSDGTIYVGSSDHKLYAIETQCEGLLASDWPKNGQNNKNTSRNATKNPIP